jgi:thymidylate synthase (FAD)
VQPFEEIQRARVPGMDEILGKPFRVLDDGFVRAVDYMGSDAAVVQAARVSYGRGTKKVSEDRTLIRYLMRHRHTTPFEMCEVKLHVRVPMDCWRQWIRHRTANVNEYSTRYSLAIDAARATSPEEWRLQSDRNRQGSSGLLDPETGKRFSERERELHEFARGVYNERIGAGIAREQARKDLPLSTYTEAYWKIDLANLFHFLSLRMEANAQAEIRSYAGVIGNEIVARWCPLSWEAFQDYVVHTVAFSADEKRILGAMLSGDAAKAVQIAEELGWLAAKNGRLKHHYERAEFEEKMKGMGVAVPWAKGS